MYTPLGSPFNLATDPSVFSLSAPPMKFLERLNNVIAYHIGLWKVTTAIREQDKYVEQFFGPGYPNNIELIKDFSLILLNHDSSINGIRTFTPAIVPVGGLHIVDRNETLSKVCRYR